MTVVLNPGVVAEIRIDEPPTRNALGLTTLRDLRTALHDAGSDAATRVVVLRGHDAYFSSGANLKEEVAVDELVEAVQSLFKSIATASVPVLARVDGFCFGLAVGLVASCDLVVAASDTRFALPEVRQGRVASLVVPTLAAKLRQGDLLELLLTATEFDGVRARSLGLVNATAARSEVDRTLRSWADSLQAGDATALAHSKSLVRTFAHARRHELDAAAAQLTLDLAPHHPKA